MTTTTKKEKPRFQRVTSKRQVTLPAKWAHEYGEFDTVVISKQKKGFFVQPVFIPEEDDNELDTFIDFTEGGAKPGISQDEFTAILEEAWEKRNNGK